MSAIRPVGTCFCDDHDPAEPRWHAFEVVREQDGHLLAQAVVCPKCVATKGLDAAVVAALIKAVRADQNAN
jgi:hypothetical protein